MRSTIWVFGAILALSLCLTTMTTVAFAQQSVAAAATSQPTETVTTETTKTVAKTDQPFGLTSKTMTGDWFGLGPEMRDLGIDVKYFWNTHFFSVMGGGRETDSGKFSHTYDLLATFDLGKMKLLKDAEVLVHARQQWGRSVNPWVGPENPASRTRAGAQQVNDDADYDLTLYVDQLWFRQHFLDRKIALQVGYLDYQTIVDHNAFANSEDKQFMNAALDNNPLLPTASAAGLGAALYVKPCDYYTLILGAGDAERLPLYKPGFSTTFHDHAYFLGYMEHDLHVKIPSPNGPLAGNYRFGLVYDPLPRAKFIRAGLPADTDEESFGFYMSHDQMLFRENDRDAQGLGCFFRFAYQPSNRYRFNKFWSIGTMYKGLIPTRDADVMGFAFAQLKDSPAFRRWRNANSGNESIYEFYYAIQVTPWLVVSPDIQYIDNPGAGDTVSHAIAGGVRVRVTF